MCLPSVAASVITANMQNSQSCPSTDAEGISPFPEDDKTSGRTVPKETSGWESHRH